MKATWTSWSFSLLEYPLHGQESHWVNGRGCLNWVFQFCFSCADARECWRDVKTLNLEDDLSSLDYCYLIDVGWVLFLWLDAGWTTRGVDRFWAILLSRQFYNPTGSGSVYQTKYINKNGDVRRKTGQSSALQQIFLAVSLRWSKVVWRSARRTRKFRLQHEITLVKDWFWWWDRSMLSYISGARAFV